QQCVEALLGEHIVEDVRQAPVRLDARGPLRRIGEEIFLDQPKWESMVAHRQGWIRLYSRSGAPFFRTDTQQSAVESGWYPPVEGFLFLTSGHRGGMARARATTSAANFLPAEPSMPALRQAAAGCKGCDLWRLGT